MAEVFPTAADVKPRGMLVRFVERLPADSPALATFSHPQKTFAVAEPASVEQWLAESAPGGDRSDRLPLLLLPAGIASPQELQCQALDRMHCRGHSNEPPTVELLLRSERILWRPGRALLIGPPDSLDEVLPGLIEFAFYEGELRRLEREVEADWPTLESDGHMTHSVGRAVLARRGHIDEMTIRTLQRRMRFV
ncbi:MAG TPA: hypothetical protein VKB78_07700, partial [Pirellulales bacterium]|nr:hypothetical protein [Pirellulales bacterium]